MPISHRDANGFDGRIMQTAAQDFPRRFGKRSVGYDIIDHPSTRIQIVAERSDVGDGRLVITENRIVIFSDALDNAVEL
jgi:hypothetical protein